MLSLTATDLPRFMACNGSRNITSVETVFKESLDREEGIAAHWLCEQVFKGEYEANELIDRKSPNGVYITSEIVQNTMEYIEQIQGKGWVELNTDHSALFYEVRGRADHIYHDKNEKTLYVDDFKYGWTIVSPVTNWTLLSHAFGYMSQYESNDIYRFVFRIFQPRPYHPEGKVRVWSINRKEMNILWEQFHNVMKNPSSKLNTGNHCKNCPRIANCPAALSSIHSALEYSEHSVTLNLSNQDLTMMMTLCEKTIDTLQQAYASYKDLALQRMKNGDVLTGYMLDNELGQTSWNDNVTADFLNALTGIDLTQKKLVTPAEAKRRGVPEEVIGSLCGRRNKGVKLVKVDIGKRAEKIFGKRS